MPWTESVADPDRVIAVGVFLMALAERPRDVTGAESLPVGDRLFMASVRGVGVGRVWLIGDDDVHVLRLRDLRSGREWGAI